MLRVRDVKLPLDHDADALRSAAARALGVRPVALLSCEVRRQAIDARKKANIHLICTVDVSVRDEQSVLRRCTGERVGPAPDERYQPAQPGSEALHHRPVVVGSGPAGLFAALTLAQVGYRPIVMERGKPVAQRCADVERFWREGVLDPQSNTQFGEGGAGTFSDGKLSTLINDPRCRKVLEEFVAAGAPADILVSGKPHVGTDRLRGVVTAMRHSIEQLGGEVSFRCRVSGLRLEGGVLAGVEVNGNDVVACDVAVLAVGHSARDTFAMLLESGVSLVHKPFAVGVRIEHPQRLIDQAQYGPSAGHPRLGPADYKLAWHGPTGRSAYTFCMCPGGEVMAAASQPGGVVTNGMSRSSRDGHNANAALLVNVEPADFGAEGPLAGFRFQQRWEEAAFQLAGQSFAAPVQLLRDFLAARPSSALGQVTPTYRPGVTPGDLRGCLPAWVCDTIAAAVPSFSRRVHGFDLPEALLTGVETRSSCPVRMARRQDMQSDCIGGLYPAGEGAGYAGGIMSAAVDGIKAAEAIIARYACPR